MSGRTFLFQVCDSVDDTEISYDWSKETDEGDDQRSRSQMKENEQLPRRLVFHLPCLWMLEWVADSLLLCGSNSTIVISVLFFATQKLLQGRH
ncbi:hypothetical protein HanPSC8_Chr03g0135001 [Helianthus annuus]|nr:hypothetical protein HanPSC8_Chr03g0135001 [Helianthus annuus]